MNHDRPGYGLANERVVGMAPALGAGYGGATSAITIPPIPQRQSTMLTEHVAALGASAASAHALLNQFETLASRLCGHPSNDVAPAPFTNAAPHPGPLLHAAADYLAEMDKALEQVRSLVAKLLAEVV